MHERTTEKPLTPAAQQGSDSPTETLARFAAHGGSAAIPEATLACVEHCLLDFIGIAAYAACFADSSPAFRRGAAQLDGGAAEFTVVGDPARYPRGQAVLLNGAFAHTMDFDDTNGTGLLHPGAPVWPALLAAVETGQASGRDLVQAAAIGYEVVARIGSALGATAYARGFHLTSVAGVFGAIAAVGCLQGLSSRVVAAAMGLAGSLASGSMQYLENGAWNKRLHPGFAARNALAALAFAQAEVLAAAEPLAGRFGLLNGYSNAPRPEKLTEGLGQNWIAAETAIKPYPSCRFAHAAIDAALKLRARPCGATVPEDSFHIELSPEGFAIVGEALPHKVAARTVVDAQFSVYFQFAVAWLDGGVQWQHYDQLGAERIDALARRIHVTANPALPSLGARVHCGEASEYVPAPLGEPSRPLGRGGIRRKFLGLAGDVYGPARADALADRILAARSAASAAALVRSLQR